MRRSGLQPTVGPHVLSPAGESSTHVRRVAARKCFTPVVDRGYTGKWFLEPAEPTLGYGRTLRFLG